MDNYISEYDKYKQPFDERLIEIVRGKRYNSYDYLKKHHNLYQVDEPICVQYGSKQRPVPSFGIAFYNVSQKRWLVVEPKFTIEFISLMKGMYTIHSLPFLIDQLYDTELELILTDPNPSDIANPPEKRVYHNIHRVMFGSDTIQILYENLWVENFRLIISIASSVMERRRNKEDNCMQCIFPKGRSSGHETWAETALREVYEETGIQVMFDNPSHMIERLNSKYASDLDMNIWEPCQVKIHKKKVDGYISRLHVTHTHSTMGGKLYRTVIWICVVSLGDDEFEEFKVTDNSETRLGIWMGEEDMRKNFRVQDLYTKCETLLNKYYPYLSF